MDVCPTILDLAGLELPAECEGLSLVPMIQGSDLDVRESIFATFQRDQELGVEDPWQRSVRRGDWKLIETGAVGEQHTQLFNLGSDPWEMRNLATQADHAARLDAMRSLLMHERAVVEDTLRDERIAGS
jgi:arylsulfatase A-like enzyme